jgi:hypothetical protein
MSAEQLRALGNNLDRKRVRFAPPQWTLAVPDSFLSGLQTLLDNGG